MRLIILFICPLIFSCAVAVTKAPECQPKPQNLEKTIESALASVVTIGSTHTLPERISRTAEAANFDGFKRNGTGFVVKGKSFFYVVTNAHVVKSMPHLEVRGIEINFEVWTMGSCEKLETELVYKEKLRHHEPDLAIFRIKGPHPGLSSLNLGENIRILLGKKVYLLGLRDNIENQVLSGHITSTCMHVPFQPKPFLVAQMPMRPGNSGSPLVDSQGYLLGVGQLYGREPVGEGEEEKYTDEGYFIPASYVQKLIERIERMN